MSKKLKASYWFRSSSSNTLYNTLEYSDGTTSCDCRGWTFKRVTTPNGQRSCKHTRLVTAGRGEATAETWQVFNVGINPPEPASTRPPTPPPDGKRKIII